MKIKADVAKTTKEVVSGLKNEKSAPYVIGFLLVLVCVGFTSLVTYLVFQNTGQNNKYYLESITASAQAANHEVKTLSENISIAKSSFRELKEEFTEFKTSQSEIKNTLKDHEKRLMRIEIKGKLNEN